MSNLALLIGFASSLLQHPKKQKQPQYIGNENKTLKSGKKKGE